MSTIRLDHFIVPSDDKVCAARFLAELLDVPWSDSQGFFAPVYVSDTLTVDFGDFSPFEVHHYCFQVDDQAFDAIHQRLITAGVPFRSSPHGEMDNEISTSGGGKNLFWFCPDGHNWEILTVSYARQPVS